MFMDSLLVSTGKSFPRNFLSMKLWFGHWLFHKKVRLEGKEDDYRESLRDPSFNDPTSFLSL